MNTAIQIAAAAIAVTALSTAAAADQDSPNTLLWNCSHEGAPTLTQVKHLFDTSNNSYASALRLRLVMQLRAECKRGPRQVLMVLHRPVEDEAIAMVASPILPDTGR